MAATTKLSPAKWLDLIAAKAPALRKAGVLRVELNDAIVQLAPEYPSASTEKAPRQRSQADPLDDETTYGLGYVPGFPRAGRRDHGDME
jgi:hypothetical protein